MLNIVTLKYMMLIFQRAMWTNGYSLSYTYHTHVNTEQVTGSYVNLPMNNHTRRSYDLLPVHCPVKKQHTAWFFWDLFWPEIFLAKIMHGNMPCHDAKFIYLYKVWPFFEEDAGIHILRCESRILVSFVSR